MTEQTRVVCSTCGVPLKRSELWHLTKELCTACFKEEAYRRWAKVRADYAAAQRATKPVLKEKTSE